LEDETLNVEREGREELTFLERIHEEEMQTKKNEFEEKKYADD
jgi:hypothetical protein